MATEVKNIMDTQIPDIFSTGLYTELNYDVPRHATDKLLYVMIMGVAEILHDVKTKEHPIAFTFEENNGEFIAASVVQHMANEDDPSKPGSWNITWTFDKDDVPKDAEKITPYDTNLISYFRNLAHSKFGMGFYAPDYVGDTMKYLLKVIKNYLHENVKEDQEVGVRDDVAIFRASVEDGKVVIGLTLDGEAKQLVKDDESIEKKVA